jgi:predicted ATPase/DNA-binding SARP family transcriptional activator
VADALTLLDAVRWRGAPVVGERPQALLAALAARPDRPVRSERLVDVIWGDEPPANRAKALQVLVSRTRSACGPEAAHRDGDGYRLGLAAEEVDSARLAARALAAGRALDVDPAEAADLAREALAIGERLLPAGEEEQGPLAELRRDAARQLAGARLVLARASARTGAHADALPTLEAARARRPDDEGLLADLLRSEAAVRGPAAALERYETHRVTLRERLGANPGEALRAVHRDLLALDSPVREGLRFDVTALLGREEDLRRLRALLATSRVVSIVGPGGLGKTRLAHVLARGATQPVVHVVELVGVTAGEDLVGEVGSVLGVRDSVSGRRSLTPQQRADLRSRIVHALAQAPSLLVLDNCEHLIDDVAALVAFLVSATPDLTVLTTTRAPLAIAAERTYPLGELAGDDAVELFRQRATAARPDVRLDPDAVRSVVLRLDGLPLAIELAAAKVRVMSVEDVDRRLADRFALLRGGDRSAPDRHRTLLAVIDWSWNLLDERERRALRWLSVFHDGFTLEAAEELLGDDALDAVQSLADQSLLSVRETPAGVRHRMLETVREFGALRLAEADGTAQARLAHRGWAARYAARHAARAFGPDQVEALDAIAVEEANLADALRGALADAPPDPAAVAQIAGGLGTLWSLRGDHGRLLALVDPVAQALDGWDPPAAMLDAARGAGVVMLTNATVVAAGDSGPLRALLERVGPGDGPQMSAAVRVALAFRHPHDPATAAALEQLGRDPDRHVARLALQWSAHAREHGGDPRAAVDAAERALALTRPEDGVWATANLRTQLAQLVAALGDHEGARRHAAAAIPALVRLGADDDVVQLHGLIAIGAIAEGRLEDAARVLDDLGDAEAHESAFGGRVAIAMGRAELELARADRAGLARYRDVTATMRSLVFPGMPTTGLEPWILFGEACCLNAHARWGAPVDERYARELRDTCRDRTARTLAVEGGGLDFPATGVGLFALGAWGVLRDDGPLEVALELLALAAGFAYNRWVPSMSWDVVAARADEREPGALDRALTAVGDRRGRVLLEPARRAVAAAPGAPQVPAPAGPRT